MHAHNKSGSTARLQDYIGNLAAWSCFPIKVSCGGSVSKKQKVGWEITEPNEVETRRIIGPNEAVTRRMIRPNETVTRRMIGPNETVTRREVACSSGPPSPGGTRRPRCYRLARGGVRRAPRPTRFARGVGAPRRWLPPSLRAGPRPRGRSAGLGGFAALLVAALRVAARLAPSPAPSWAPLSAPASIVALLALLGAGAVVSGARGVPPLSPCPEASPSPLVAPSLPALLGRVPRWGGCGATRLFPRPFGAFSSQKRANNKSAG